MQNLRPVSERRWAGDRQRTHIVATAAVLCSLAADRVLDGGGAREGSNLRDLSAHSVGGSARWGWYGRWGNIGRTRD